MIRISKVFGLKLITMMSLLVRIPEPWNFSLESGLEFQWNSHSQPFVGYPTMSLHTPAQSTHTQPLKIPDQFLAKIWYTDFFKAEEMMEGAENNE